MQDCTEGLVSMQPLIMRRRVLWGECDPAGVVYTPRFSDYVVAGCDFWFRHVLKHLNRPHPARKQIVFPMRAMSIEFTEMLEADDYFEMTVSLANLGRRSIALDISATSQGVPAFAASTTQIAFDQAQGKSVEIPQDLRARLEGIAAAASACDPPRDI